MYNQQLVKDVAMAAMRTVCEAQKYSGSMWLNNLNDEFETQTHDVKYFVYSSVLTIERNIFRCLFARHLA